MIMQGTNLNAPPTKQIQICPYLVKQLFSCCAGLDGKLQLSVHSSDAHIHLKTKKNTEGLKNANRKGGVALERTSRQGAEATKIYILTFATAKQS